MDQPIIKAEGVEIDLQGKTILKDINFSLNRGEHLIITGCSGSGKTSLAKAIAGKLYAHGKLEYHFKGPQLKPTHSVLFIEQRYTLKNRGNLSSGFYYQQRFNSADTEDCYTVEEELSKCSEDKAKINLLLEELGLTERRHAPLIQLSSGEHKRFQLTKALLKPAPIMVLDEPFIGLDYKSREKLYQIIDHTAAKGTTFIIISGSHHRFPQCITHVLTLENGKIKSFTAKQDFHYETTTASTKQVINIENIPFYPREDKFRNVIQMINTTVKYGEKTILDNINWTVRRGEKWLIQGHNGAGKSTLLSLVTGDNPQAYANEIYIFDKRRGEGETIWDIKKPIGFVSPERFAFYNKNITVYETVASGLFDTMGLFRKLTAEQELRVKNWLEVFHFWENRSERLSLLPSGQQRMILLVAALVKNPPVLLLDEPCQGLDEYQTASFIKMIDIICSKIDTTLLYISHYKSEIPKCIDHLLQLDHGKATTELRITKEELEKEKTLNMRSEL